MTHPADLNYQEFNRQWDAACKELEMDRKRIENLQATIARWNARPGNADHQIELRGSVSDGFDLSVGAWGCCAETITQATVALTALITGLMAARS